MAPAKRKKLTKRSRILPQSDSPSEGDPADPTVGRVEEASQAGEELYYVEKVVDKRDDDAEIQYQVKWLDWSPDWNQWVSLQDLRGSSELIKEYEKTAKAQRVSQQASTSRQSPAEPVIEYPDVKSRALMDADIHKLLYEDLGGKPVKILKMTVGDSFACQPDRFDVLFEDGFMFTVDENYVRQLSEEKRELFRKFTTERAESIAERRRQLRLEFRKVARELREKERNEQQI